MIDDADEMSELISSCSQKARKDHICSECSRIIKKGEVYVAEFLKNGGDTSYYKTCAHCQVCREWLLSECSGFVYEQVYEDMMEHATNGLYPMAVMRLAIGMKKEWTRKDGNLLSIPKMPLTSDQYKL